MNDRPLIFLSHASRDKPRLDHLVDYLLDAGFRLFIDHPEAIPGFTRDICKVRGIEGLWTTEQNKWPERLDEAISECDCVLVVLSEAMTTDGVATENTERRVNHRIEWRHEISGGHWFKKLAFAKIGSFDSAMLPGDLRGIDAQDVRHDLDQRILAASLEILVKDRIPAAIRSGRRARLGNDGDELRSLADLLPLCVGRRYQRTAVMKSFRLLKQTRRIHPVVVAGPENELPFRFLEALPYQDDGDRNLEGVVCLKLVDWPIGPARDFADDYASSLGAEICGDVLADLPEVAKAIATEGHPTVIHSRIDLMERRIEHSRLSEWLDFWVSNQEIFSAAQVAPVVSLFLGEARPGWTGCPPPEADNPHEYRRNLDALAWLEQLAVPDGAEGERCLRPRLTEPIIRSQATTWADKLHQDVLGERRRSDLQAKIDDLYPDEEVRRVGVNHKRFHEEMARWLEGK